MCQMSSFWGAPPATQHMRAVACAFRPARASAPAHSRFAARRHLAFYRALLVVDPDEFVVPECWTARARKGGARDGGGVEATAPLAASASQSEGVWEIVCSSTPELRLGGHLRETRTDQIANKTSILPIEPLLFSYIIVCLCVSSFVLVPLAFVRTFAIVLVCALSWGSGLLSFLSRACGAPRQERPAEAKLLFMRFHLLWMCVALCVSPLHHRSSPDSISCHRCSFRFVRNMCFSVAIGAGAQIAPIPTREEHWPSTQAGPSHMRTRYIWFQVGFGQILRVAVMTAALRAAGLSGSVALFLWRAYSRPGRPAGVPPFVGALVGVG